MDVAELHRQVKAFLKDKNIQFVIPHQVRSPHGYGRYVPVPDNGILIIDYIGMLAPVIPSPVKGAEQC